MLAVAPWNYPYLTAVNSVVPGLIAGNAVILKARGQTILVGERFQAALDTAGLPNGLFQHACARSRIDTAKSDRAAVDQVNFTGSVEGGPAIERAAAGTFTTSGLSSAARTPPMYAPTPTSRTRSRTSSTARCSIPASAAAASSASMCIATRMDRFVEGSAR